MANAMRETGSFGDDLAKQVYKVAGKEEPPTEILGPKSSQEFGRSELGTHA